METYHSLLKQAIDQCEAKEISGEAAQILLLELCNLSNTDLYLKYDDEVDENIRKSFLSSLERLLNDEPLQYILGYQWFYGYKIKVNENCLIPRYETEELVANVLADSDFYFPDQQSISIADVGTGSGAIAIALKKEEPRFKMYATDISGQALALAEENCRLNECEITLLEGDMLKPLIDAGIKLDILVSNPPYIPSQQPMQESVVNFEPHVALFGGEDGLYFYRRIFEDALKVIKDHSFMAFEIGYDEKYAIIALVKEYFPNDNFDVLKDINGKDRMLFVYHNLSQ